MPHFSVPPSSPRIVREGRSEWPHRNQTCASDIPLAGDLLTDRSRRKDRRRSRRRRRLPCDQVHSDVERLEQRKEPQEANVARETEEAVNRALSHSHNVAFYRPYGAVALAAGISSAARRRRRSLSVRSGRCTVEV